MVGMFLEEPQFSPDGSRIIGLPPQLKLPRVSTRPCGIPGCHLCSDTPRGSSAQIAEHRNEFDQQEWNGVIDNAEMAIEDAVEKFGW